MKIARWFVIAFCLRLVLSFGSSHPDLGNHLDWGVKFWELGPKNFYENLFWQVSWANQPPGSIYLFALIRKIYELIFGLSWWLNLKIPLFPSTLIPLFQEKLYVSLIKLPSILADLGIAALVYKFVAELKNKKRAKLAALVFLLNPVSWYNSAIWGQTDAIINFFGLWSIYLFWKKHPLWAIFIYFLSLYFKGSLIIFAPLVAILLLKAKTEWWKKLFILVTSPFFLAYLSLPFVKWMGPIPWLYHLYRDRVFGHQGNMLTANAFNLWALIFGIDFTRNDLGVFLGLTYKTWGQFLFGSVLLPVLAALTVKKSEIKLILWSLVILSLTSFVFLTNMHERYLYPVFPYFTILVFLSPNLGFQYFLLSLSAGLNLYHLWYVPEIFGLRNLFCPLMIQGFSFLNLALAVYFLFSYFRNLRLKKL